MSRAAVLALVVAATACVPTFGAADSLVTSTRVLAVRAEPAEAPPGDAVTFTALVADPKGTVTTAPIDWSFCNAPKPVTEDNVVSRACLGAGSLVPAGTGPTTIAALPTNGCSIFGPDTSAAGLRPRDPDGTGGYYQPLRVSLAGAGDAFALARIHCNLAQADGATASAFAAAYRLNHNPKLLPVAIVGAIARGSRIMLQVGWDRESAETFATFDVATQSLGQQRESMRVSWYVSDGSLDTETTGRAADDQGTTTDNGWTAPSTASTTHLWVVLRDSRGGVDFASVDLVVP